MQETKIDGGYFDQPSTRKLLWRILWGTCLVSVFLELFIERKSHFPIDNFFGFYAVLGFVACTACILIAKGLGFFLKRRVDYYADDE